MKKTKLTLFFTWDVSLKIWQDKGLLEREVHLYKTLAQKGVDITFITWGTQEDEDIAKAFPAINVIPAYKHIPRPSKKMLRALLSFWIPIALSNHLKQTDIIKTNQMWGAWCAIISKFLYRKKMILRCGYELHDLTVKQGHGKLRCYFIWLISKIAYTSANHICVATSEDKNYVEKTFKIDNHKITTHSNWIDISKFCPIDLPCKKSSFLFVGRLNKQKNLENLIKAIASSDYTLDIVGDGELKGGLSALAHSVNAKVNFLGKVPNDQLPQLYNSYPVFVLPSHYEGNPKTLLEAMSCGRSVLGTDVDGIRSVIKHNQNGLLCKPESADIKAKLDILFCDEKLRKKLGKRARAHIIQSHSLDSLLKKEITLYKDVLMEPENEANSIAR